LGGGTASWNLRVSLYVWGTTWKHKRVPLPLKAAHRSSLTDTRPQLPEYPGLHPASDNVPLGNDEEMFAVTAHKLGTRHEESNRIDGGSLQTDGKTMGTGGRVIAVKTRFAAT
jgi:hypothetical protein